MSEKPRALLLAFSILAIAMLLNLRRQENERLREEVRVLRLYGNKDCTAMADAAMEPATEPAIRARGEVPR